MVQAFSYNESRIISAENLRKSLCVLSSIFLFIAVLAIFQDFLHSKRNGYAFYFSESLLFKTHWFLFIPTLAVLNLKLRNERSDSYTKKITLVITSILVHLIILPLIAGFFSELFYDGRYSLYKFFSYTIANDFYSLVLIYAGFVFGYKYFSSPAPGAAIQENQPESNRVSQSELEVIVINNGTDNVVVRVKDIIQITSATPYVFIHLEKRKYLHSETLKSISGQLSGGQFIRVHKSGVVNVSKVVSFKSRLNGDYDLQLTTGDSVRLSRTYASDFKKHFNSGHQVGM